MNKSFKFRISLKQKITLVIFGIALSFILVELCLRLGGFIISSLQDFKDKRSIKQKAEYRIMCVGESTTVGSYPSILEEILNQHNIGVRFSVINKGLSAITTSAILALLESWLDKYQPDMVITMMGINDRYVKYYADIPEANTALFRNFKTYKLFRLLLKHSMDKISGNRIDNLENSIKGAKFIDDYSVVKLKNNFISEENYKQSEEHFKKIIELAPKNGNAYMKLGILYLEKQKYAQAEVMLKKALELNPENKDAAEYLGLLYMCMDDGILRAINILRKTGENDTVYTVLNRLCLNKGDFGQAEKLIEQAIGAHPGNDEAYATLAWFYRSDGKLFQAEESYLKAIELNPKYDGAYIELAGLYQDEGKFSQAEELLKKAIETNPIENNWAYTHLGLVYRNQGKFSYAEESFKKAIELAPEDKGACRELAWLYRDEGKFSKAEELFKKCIENNSENDGAYGALEVLYEEMRNRGIAAGGYSKKIRGLKSNYYNILTVSNYYKLKEILDKRGIRLICVQYPMRSVEPLKKIFEGHGGVVFVDNEKVFKDALRESNCKEYFVDMFGGDFGHCTTKGNRLLAENIANVILKGVFKK